ncbi:MAG: HDOD domain-containing protein [Thermodesulfobacteriota bacterium]
MKDRQQRFIVFVVERDRALAARIRGMFEKGPFLVYCCEDESQALSLMEAVVADLVVCNLGAITGDSRDFFRQVRQRNPGTIRTVYGEEKDRRELLHHLLSGLAQRYLLLPWEKNRMAAGLARDLRTRSRLRLKTCWKYLDEQEQIPGVPELVAALEEVLANPDFLIRDVVRVVERDPGITARLIGVVNSPAFTRGVVINDLGMAVSYLGVHTIRELLLYFCAMEMFPASDQSRSLLHATTRSCYITSLLAKQIAADLAPSMIREIASTALLHDIGKLVMISRAGSLIAGLLPAGQEWLAQEQEEELFGFGHDELGACLLLRWNLPMSLVEAAANHHSPLAELRGACKIVAIAERCLREVIRGVEDEELPKLPAGMDLDGWRRQAGLLWRETSLLFA